MVMQIEGPVKLTQHERGVPEPSPAEQPEAMLQRAIDEYLDTGRCGVQQLIDVAVSYRDKWAELAARVEAGEYLDGRASIYTGETYAEARDRWEHYRQLLVDHVRGVAGDHA